jgi:hypothetical protein
MRYMAAALNYGRTWLQGSFIVPCGLAAAVMAQRAVVQEIGGGEMAKWRRKPTRDCCDDQASDGCSGFKGIKARGVQE